MDIAARGEGAFCAGTSQLANPLSSLGLPLKNSLLPTSKGSTNKWMQPGVENVSCR